MSFSKGWEGFGAFASVIAAIAYLQITRGADETQSEIITVSAPGKVLVAGGYLVLDQPNPGITVSVTSRFYSSVRIIDGNDDSFTIYVTSPQFYTEYEYEITVSKALTKIVSKGENENIFVERCISLVLSFVREFMGSDEFVIMMGKIKSRGSIAIKLRADNDFYSQIRTLKDKNMPLLSKSLNKLERFKPCPIGADGNVEIAKTGLGSSAALVTSLVGSLLHFFGVVNIKEKSAADVAMVHNLSQLVHANAQGKIGSGFDVSAAVYGTQRYVRFNPKAFDNCMKFPVAGSVLLEAVTSQTKWDHDVRGFELPPHMNLVLGDVCGGSSSTSMAKAVLQWRDNNPVEASAVWDELKESNADIYDLFCKLQQASKKDAAAYSSAISWASSTTYAQWQQRSGDAVVALLVALHDEFVNNRRWFKKMGECAGVETEPDAQTELANATMEVPGVVAAGVPGAGGVDALFALVLSISGREEVEKLWSEWGVNHVTSVCPLLLTSDNESFRGIQVHDDVEW